MKVLEFKFDVSASGVVWVVLIPGDGLTVEVSSNDEVLCLCYRLLWRHVAAWYGDGGWGDVDVC